MSKGSRIFTVEEVDALLPELSERVGRLLDRRLRIVEDIAALGALTGQQPPSLESQDDDPPEVAALRRSLQGQIRSYEDGWSAIERFGATVKDPQTGLLDFYGQIDGRLVWLCWRYGETELGWYHDLQAGFAHRRALVRRELLN